MVFFWLQDLQDVLYEFKFVLYKQRNLADNTGFGSCDVKHFCLDPLTVKETLTIQEFLLDVFAQTESNWT